MVCYTWSLPFHKQRNFSDPFIFNIMCLRICKAVLRGEVGSGFEHEKRSKLCLAIAYLQDKPNSLKEFENSS